MKNRFKEWRCSCKKDVSELEITIPAFYGKMSCGKNRKMRWCNSNHFYEPEVSDLARVKGYSGVFEISETYENSHIPICYVKLKKINSLEKNKTLLQINQYQVVEK